MPRPVDFYFDFSSPYGYLAAHRIDEIAARHGREVTWRPFLLGVVFKETGSGPLLDMPMKGAYTRIDLPRSARLLGVPFVLPKPFPFMAVAASRAFYWQHERDPAAAKRLARAVYDAAFRHGRAVGGAAAVGEIAAAVGLDRAAAEAANQDPVVKDLLRREVQAAVARGVFGSPYVIVDDEPFWGVDHLDQVDRWLSTGGW